MSIYGGFGQRIQETNYNKAVYNLLYLMQLKISRNSKNRNYSHISTSLVPFDDHKFQSIFIKLYNRLFTQEEFKYLPPKFSYALKDLACDLGIFERADVSSVISSGSTNMSMTTTSGFNMNFNDPPGSVTAMMIKAERDLAAQALPLSTIKESATSRFSNSNQAH